MVKIEFWERDATGKLIPKDAEITLYGEIYDRTIQSYRDKLEVEINEQNKIIYQETISAIQKEKDSEEKIKIKFTPLVSYELNLITSPSFVDGKVIGCDGTIVEDLDANICAVHCLEPKLNYNQWRDLKDDMLKKIISKHIYQSSKPTSLEELKKKIMGQMSQIKVQ